MKMSLYCTKQLYNFMKDNFDTLKIVLRFQNVKTCGDW